MASNEIDKPTSQCFLTQLPKDQALVKMVLNTHLMHIYTLFFSCLYIATSVELDLDEKCTNNKKVMFTESSF